MSTDILRKYLDIVDEAEAAVSSVDFTQQALRSDIAKKLVGGDPKGYNKFKLYFAPLVDKAGYKQVDVRLNGEGPSVPPVDDSLAVVDSRGQFFFKGDTNGQQQRLLPNLLQTGGRFSDPEKNTVKDMVFKMMHPATMRGGSRAYQQVASYAESKKSD
jgi:hypothetical protein